MSRNHQTKPEHADEHLINTQAPGVRDTMQRNSLPRTIQPEYLMESPLQEQERHLDSFHRNQPQANHAGDRDGFSRPGLGDNLELIVRNLSDSHYFEMPYRAPFDRRITTGDGTPDTVVPE